jgi:predicted aminopeptidase
LTATLRRSKRLRRWLTAIFLVLIVAAVSGCRTISFYSQAVKGQYQIFAHEKRIDKLLADPSTAEKLRNRLQLIQALRSFAESDLKLPVDAQYKKYVDVHRPFVVWNVEAAPQYSLEPKGWWYPVVGSLEYRGYFSKEGAMKYGNYLHEHGYDVHVAGVEAYSTLGWFKDPVLNTFIFEPDADLAEIIFHELGHQEVFARGDKDFNEAFATTVGEQGARRWLKAKQDPAALEKYENERRRTRQFVALVAGARVKLEKLYGDERTPEGRIKAARKQIASPEVLRKGKEEILAGLKTDYAILKTNWGGATDYDGWFSRQINNAQLNSVAAYYDLVPGFERLLELNHGDLELFYDEARRLAKLPKKERHQRLLALGTEGEPAPASP